MHGGIDKAQYRIGPLTMYVEPADLQAWHDRAAVGATTFYAIGPALSERSPTANLARALHARGEAGLFLERKDNRLHYMIRKREKPAPPAAVTTARTMAAIVPAGPQAQMYGALCALAEAGRPLPSLEELSELAGLSDRRAAHYRLNQLSTAGIVRVVTLDGVRAVEIVATGERTACPLPAGGR